MGASSGESLIIGGLLGHTRATTTQRYAHLSQDPLRSASEAIGARIVTAMNGGTSEGATDSATRDDSDAS